MATYTETYATTAWSSLVAFDLRRQDGVRMIYRYLVTVSKIIKGYRPTFANRHGRQVMPVCKVLELIVL